MKRSEGFMIEGKLSNEKLKKLVFQPIKKRRKELVRKPDLGEDVAYLQLENELMVLTTDPITGASKNLGKLAVDVCVNDLAAGGAEPLGILVTLLIPPETKEEEIQRIMEDIEQKCQDYNMDILGGHTEISSAVRQVVISTAAIGRGKRVLEGVKEGDCIILTKSLALEGTAIFAKEKPDLRTFLSQEELDQALSFWNHLSVLKESRIAMNYPVHFMHDVTEGGLIGALCEVMEKAGYGFVIDKEKISVEPVTQKICDYYSISVYHLISSGALLIFTDEKEGRRLVEDLKKQGISSEIIGRVTKEKEYVLKGDTHIHVKPKKTDELYTVMGGDNERN